MTDTTDSVTVDLDALDAEAAKKTTNSVEKSANGADGAPVVVETAATEPVKAEKDDKTVVTPEEALGNLQKQLDSERTLRVAAESRANESAKAEARARGERQETQVDFVKGAIARLSGEGDALELKYAEHAAAGDWAAAGKVQRQMGKNEAELLQLQNGLKRLEAEPKPVPRTAADPVEDAVSTMTPKSAAWVRAHPEFVRDPAKFNRMLAAHSMALADGHPVESPGYFASIETLLGVTPAAATPREDPESNLTTGDDAVTEAAKPKGGRTGAAPAAPPSRSGAGPGSKPGRVTLTPQQVEMAAHMGMSNEEYARQVVELKKEGRLQ